MPISAWACRRLASDWLLLIRIIRTVTSLTGMLRTGVRIIRITNDEGSHMRVAGRTARCCNCWLPMMAWLRELQCSFDKAGPIKFVTSDIGFDWVEISISHSPHFTWLNSIVFVSFPVCGSTTFQMTHDLLPWPTPSNVTWPSHQNINAHSTCIWKRVSIVLIKDRMLYYGSCWKRKSNKGILRCTKVWYCNCSINIVEMSCKSFVKTLQRELELRETSERNIRGVRECQRRVGKLEHYHAGVKTWLQL